MNWIKKILGLDKQDEKINRLTQMAQIIMDKESNIDHNQNIDDKKQLQKVKETIDKIAIEILPKEFNPNYKLVDPLDITKTLFSFETNSKTILNKRKISVNAESFLQNLGSTIPELVSNGLLMNSYRFVFPQGVSGKIIQMASGQGTAIMQAGKIVKHGGYVSTMAVGAPLLVVSIGSMVVRQHYLAKINKNLDEINLKVSHLLDLEFIKKHSKVESIIYFLEKAHYEFPFIENNKEYRNAILTNLVRTNIEIFELIQFYKKSFKFIDREKPAENELNLKYFLALHTLFNQGKLLEFKYAMEYNETLISNLQTSFININNQSIDFLKENQMELYGKIQTYINDRSNFDWILGKKSKKEQLVSDLTSTKEIIIQFMINQREEVEKVNNELEEFKTNLIRKQEFLIENGDLYEVLE